MPRSSLQQASANCHRAFQARRLELDAENTVAELLANDLEQNDIRAKVVVNPSWPLLPAPPSHAVIIYLRP